MYGTLELSKSAMELGQEADENVGLAQRRYEKE